MPYTELAVTYPTHAGVTLTPVTGVTGGHKFANDGQAILFVKTAAGVGGTVTISIPVTVEGQSVTPLALTVPSDANMHLFGPFTPAHFNQPVGATDAGEVHVDYDTAANYTVAVIHP